MNTSAMIAKERLGPILKTDRLNTGRYPGLMTLETTTTLLPLKTVGGLNAREHWRARATRVKHERWTAAMLVPRHVLPCVVTMTRLSPGTLDDDNMQGAMKAVRDGIADKLGVKDNDKRIHWRYDQRRCKAGEYGVEVTISHA